MIIVDLKIKGDMQDIEKLFPKHQAFLEKNYKEKLFVYSGPKNPFTGGVIIVDSDDYSLVDQLVSDEPFVKADLAEYQLMQFDVTMSRD